MNGESLCHPPIRLRLAEVLGTAALAASLALPDGTMGQAATKAQLAGAEGGSALTAMAIVDKQTYCHSDNTSFVVNMDVSVHLTNTSNSTLILSKRIGSPPVVRVAKNSEAAKAGQYEYAPNMDTFYGETPAVPVFGDAPSAEDFVRLAPGESFDARIQTGVFGTKEATSGHGLVSRGTHVLLLGIDTWPYRYDITQGLRTKWAQFGELQTELVYTNFVPFTIPEKFKNPRCPVPSTPQKQRPQ